MQCQSLVWCIFKIYITLAVFFPRQFSRTYLPNLSFLLCQLHDVQFTQVRTGSSATTEGLKQDLEDSLRIKPQLYFKDKTQHLCLSLSLSNINMLWPYHIIYRNLWSGTKHKCGFYHEWPCRAILLAQVGLGQPLCLYLYWRLTSHCAAPETQPPVFSINSPKASSSKIQ